MTAFSFAPSKGINAPVYFIRLAITGVILWVLLTVVMGLLSAESSRFATYATKAAPIPLSLESEAAQHFSSGAAVAFLISLGIVAFIIFGLSFLQRAVDAGQSRWVGLIAGVSLFIAIFCLGLVTTEVMHGGAITSPRALACLLSSLVLSVPPLMLGALKSCQCPT